ncbi:hypothetical protein ACN47E_008958 [Coniothyrium glycines]
MATKQLEDFMTEKLASHLQRDQDDDRPIVLMTCGMAGAGKTTLAKHVLLRWPSFHRLSMDEIINEKHGIYGVDYPASASLYEQYLDEADTIYLSKFHNFLADKKNVILEKSFHAKQDRAEWRAVAETAGARVVFVFLKAEGDAGRELLWERICKRSQGAKTANSALDISRELFDEYWKGFEEPDGEGEIVLKIAGVDTMP